MRNQKRQKMTRLVVGFVVFTFIAGLLPMLFSI
jgi:hypothetical protein